MVEGCKIHDASKLNPGYEKIENGYIANVNAEDIAPLMEHFISLQDDRVFLILEVPTNEKDEPKNQSGDIEAFHIDVYYWDGMPKDYAMEFLRRNHELLVHDGMSRFGFGSHSGNNEIMLDQYNVVRIYTKYPEMYNGMFEKFGIEQVDELKTAWKYFTYDTPGECCLYNYKGKTIYDFAEFLKQHGLYFAERREK